MENQDKMRRIFANTAETLKSADATAVEKLAARDAALKTAEQLGATPERMKTLKGKMMNFIKEGRLKATGPIGGFAMDDAARAGGKFLKGGKKASKKAVPGLGMVLAGITALTDSPSAAASELAEGAKDALIPGGVGNLGPQKGSPEAIMESTDATPEDRAQAAEQARSRFAADPVMGQAMQKGYNVDADKATVMAEAEENPLLQEIKRNARKEALMSKIK